MKICKNCQKEIAKRAVICPHCGIKIRKPLYKRVSFYLLLVLAIFIGFFVIPSETPEPISIEEITFEPVTVEELYDGLNANALKAEQTYQDKYIELTGRLSNIDSDGDYISLDCEKYLFETVICSIEEKHLEYVMNLTEGEEITLVGQITDIGEVMGYSVEVYEFR